MNYKLRRRHQLVWILWAILIPLALLTAYSSLPQQRIPVESELLYAGVDMHSNKLLGEKQAEGILWRLWENRDTTLLVEGIVQQSLRSPAAFVYVVPESGALISSGNILGKLGPKGSYSFPLDSAWNTSEKIYVLVHDPVRKETLQTIELVP